MAASLRTSAAGGSTSGTSNRTVAITPAVGDLFVVICHVATNTTSNPTCSDNNGGSYTLIGTALNNASADITSVFVRTSLLANTTSTTITVATGSNTSGSVVVLAFSGMTRTGSGAVLQSKFLANQAAGTPAPAFTSAVNTNNPTVGWVSNVTSPATMTPPTGWTEAQDVGQTSNTEGLEVVTRNSGFTGTTVTWGSASASAYAAGLLELDSSPVPLNGTLTQTLGAMTAKGNVFDGGTLFGANYAFATDLQGLANTPISGSLAASWQTGDSASGSGGCLAFKTTAAGTNQECRAVASAETWETWGVPPGATVTAMSLDSYAIRMASATGFSSHQLVVTLSDSIGNRPFSTVAFVDSSDPAPSTSSAWVTGTGHQVNIDSTHQASTTVVNLLIDYTVTTSGTTNVDFRVDELKFTISYTVAGRSGTLTQTLGTLTDSAAGTNLDHGASAKTLGVLTDSAAGTNLDHGASAKTLGGLGISATGTSGANISGTLTKTLGTLTDSAAGTSLDHGAFAKTLGTLTDSAAGTNLDHGVLAKTLGSATTSGAGTNLDHGTSAKTLGAVTSSAAGTNLDHGAFAKTLGALTDTATGTVPNHGTFAKTLGSATTTAAGTNLDHGASAKTLGALSKTLTGTNLDHGAFAKTLGALTDTATGTVPNHGASAKTLGALTDSAAGTNLDHGASAKTLGTLTLVATGVIGSVATGQLIKTLGTMTSSGTGTVLDHGAFAKTLGAASSLASGKVTDLGVVTRTLGAATASAVGKNLDHGASAKSLGGLSGTATGTAVEHGGLAKTLGGLAPSAAGKNLDHGASAKTLGALAGSGAGTVGALGNLAGQASVALGRVIVHANTTPEEGASKYTAVHTQGQHTISVTDQGDAHASPDTHAHGVTATSGKGHGIVVGWGPSGCYTK